MVGSKNRKKDNNSRLNVLSYVYSFLLFGFILRLFVIQVLHHEKYVVQAEDQYWNLSVIPAQRGDIISSDNFTLAGTQTHYLMYAEPKKIDNKYEFTHKISDALAQLRQNEETSKKELFDTYYESILEKVNQDLFWVILSHNLTPVEKEEIEKLNIIGVGFEDAPVRYYPEKSLASHVLGFVAFNEAGEKQGYFGIEGALNGDLKGKPGRVLDQRDALGNPILIGDYKRSTPIKGRDVVLSINRTVQYIVEKYLKEGVEKFDAKSGSVIVMDPFTGEVLAMATYPSYNPSVYEVNEDKEDVHRKKVERRNLTMSQTYEPGSVLKPITVAAALELGKVNPDTTFVDEGPVRYSDYVIDNWDGKHHGVQTITQLLEKSNNIGAAWVGHLVGPKNLSYYLQEFGFGKKTEIELEGEDTGIIRDWETWTAIDTATVAFGQGISATPLQVLNSFNVIANGGFLVQPKIITQLIDQDEVIKMPTRQVHRVISKDTSEKMVEMLRRATSSGEAKYFVLKSYDISGKTGTAQIPVDGKYDPEKTNATFVGFLSNSKKFSMIVKLEQPHSSIYASETAVPLWMDISKELVKFFGIAPDRIINE